MADWFETRFREPIDAGELDPAFVARMRALVVEEWQADGGAIPIAGTDPDDPEGDLIMLETENRPTPAGPATSRRSPGRWLLVAAAVVLVGVVGVLLVTAGDDDPVDAISSPSTTAAPAPASDDEFCDAIDDMDSGLVIGEGYSMDAPNGVDPALEAAEELAPDEIRADVMAMTDESRAQLAAGPPPEGTPPDLPPDSFFAAAASVGDYMADNCIYNVVDVTATDHAFGGVPSAARAGKTLIQLRNDGTEYHEVVLLRVDADEDRSIEELLALPEEERDDRLQFQGIALAPPGMSSWVVVDLTFGPRYAATCFIPIGSTTEAALRSGLADPATPLHSSEGMVAELGVR